MHINLCENDISAPGNRLWDVLSLFSVLFSLGMFILQWRQLPFFLDMYYHLAAAKGFESAGGLVLHNFWEYGPAGSIHLYPPFTHIIILALLKTGITGIIALKLLSSAIPALFLYILWYVVRGILDKRAAFFAVYLCICASMFMASISFTPAATMAVTMLLFSAFSIHKGRPLSAGLVSGLIPYTHTGIAILSLIFVILSWMSGMIDTKKFSKIFTIALLAGMPWWYHIIKNMTAVSWSSSARMPLRLYPVLVFLLIIGLAKSLKDIKKYKIFFIFALSLLPMGILYPFRLIVSQGMAGVIPFAAIGLDAIYSAANSRLRTSPTAKKYVPFFLVVTLLYLIIFAPSINFFKGNAHFEVSDSQLTALFEGKEQDINHLTSTGIYDDTFFKELSFYVDKYSEKGEFIWSNYRYIAGILWCITQRPSLSYMLLEVNPKTERPDLSDASLLIVIDVPEGIFKKIYKKVKCDFYAAEKLKQQNTDIYILKNRNQGLKEIHASPKPLLGLPWLFAVICAYITAIIFCYRHGY